MTAAKQSVAEQAGTVVTQNPTTITAAIGIILQGVGALLGWSNATQAALGQITLGLALLIRLSVLAWQNARKK